MTLFENTSKKYAPVRQRIKIYHCDVAVFEKDRVDWYSRLSLALLFLTVTSSLFRSDYYGNFVTSPLQYIFSFILIAYVIGRWFYPFAKYTLTKNGIEIKNKGFITWNSIEAISSKTNYSSNKISKGKTFRFELRNGELFELKLKGYSYSETKSNISTVSFFDSHVLGSIEIMESLICFFHNNSDPQ